jgi:outer membrane immunogenic protein
MKKLLLGGVALAAVIAGPGFGSALAADLAVKAPYQALPPVLNSWTGFYIGVNAGAASWDSHWKNLDGIELWFPSSTVINNQTGFIGGGQVGYNWQVGHAVFGFEADLQYTSLDQTTTLVMGGGPPRRFCTTRSSGWQRSARDRAWRSTT